MALMKGKRKMNKTHIHSSRRMASISIQSWNNDSAKNKGLVSSELQSARPKNSEANKRTVGCAAISMAEKLRGHSPLANKLFAFVGMSGNRRHIHGHRHLVFAAAGEDAAQGADVAVVATVGDGDVVLGGQEIVCRVEVHPAELGTVHREPRVRSVRAHQPLLAFQRASAQVAAHVARGQAE